MGRSSRGSRETRRIARRARRAERLDARWFGGPRPRRPLTTGDLLEAVPGCTWIGRLPTPDEQVTRFRA